MKKILIFLFILVLICSALYLKSISEKIISFGKNDKKLVTKIPLIIKKQTTVNQQPLIVQKSENKSVFIPYWGIIQLNRLNQPADSAGRLNQSKSVKPTESANKSESSFAEATEDKLGRYDRLIYFGLSINDEEINNNDLGYKNIADFVKLTEGKDRYLTIKITELPKNNQKIIKDSIDIANKYKFKGIALDLEISGIFHEDLKPSINGLVKEFYSTAKDSGLKLTVILYGDLFYRKRPYDLDFISKNCDEVMIMAYDFHKAKGEPGPNFPLSGKEKYGYDFKTMVDDYLQYVTQDKITIIFGMFGYEWRVDEKKRPLKQAEALTLNEIKNNFLKKCEWKDCVVRRDELSKETEINYVTSEIVNNFAYLYYHIVWFEDEESVSAKIEYLKEKGIGSISYWAWGYY